MDDFDAIWDEITGNADYVTGESPNTAFDWGDYYNSLDDFEQDWLAVTGGGYTMDEIANNVDVQDLYEATQADPSILPALSNLVKSGGTKLLDTVKKAFTTPDGGVNWRSIAGVAGGLYGLSQANKPQEKAGYQGGIPKYEAVREAVQSTYDPNRRPGSGGQRYFTDTSFAAPSNAAAARTAAQEEAAGLAALNASNPARQAVPAPQPVQPPPEQPPEQAGRRASDVIQDLPVPTYAQGGIADLAAGGVPRYLAGGTDGMADKIRANIDGKQEARLSHGEFVIPADVVGHLGNGNSEAGAERLYEMMDRIRKARTGTTKQGKQINPNKFLPS